MRACYRCFLRYHRNAEKNARKYITAVLEFAHEIIDILTCHVFVSTRTFH